MLNKLKIRRHLRAAREAFNDERFKETIQHSERAMSLKPINSAADILKIKAIQKLSQNDIVFKEMDIIENKYESNSIVLVALSRLSYNMGAYSRCINFCSKALALNPSDMEMNLLKGRVSGKLGLKYESHQIFDALIDEYENSETIIEWAMRVAYESKDYPRAKKLLGKLIELSGETEIAKTIQTKLNRMIFTATDDSEPSTIKLNDIEFNIQFVKSSLANNLTHSAIDISRKLFNRNPESPRIINLYAEVASSARRTDLCQQLLKLDSEVLSPINKCKLLLQCNQIEEAEVIIKSEMESNTNAQLYRLLSAVYRKKNDLATAIKFDLIALEINERDIVSWKRLLLAHIQLGNEIEYRKLWMELITRSKDNSDFLLLVWELALIIMDEPIIDELKTIVATSNFNHQYLSKFFKVSNNFGRLDYCQYFLDEMKKFDADTKLLNICENIWINTLEIFGTNETRIRDASIIGPVHSEGFISTMMQHESCNMETKSIWWEEDPIVHITSTLSIGGSEKQLIRLAKQMKLENPNRKMYILVTDEESLSNNSNIVDEIRMAGIIVDSFDSNYTTLASSEIHAITGKYHSLLELIPDKTTIRRIQKLCSIFKQIQPGLIHSWQDHTNFMVGLASLISGSSRTILSCRSLPPIDKGIGHNRNNPGIIESYRAFSLNPRITIVHNSLFGENRFRELMGIDDERMKVVYNMTPIPNPSFSKTKNDALIVIGGVFRMVPEKRPHLWIDIAEKILEERDDVIFILYGGGKMYEEIASRIRSNKYSESIQLVGECNDMDAAYSSMDLLLHTSRVEGMPNVVLEAQAHSVPVICTKSGGSGEALLPNISGILLESEKPEDIKKIIQDAIDDTGWRNKASQAAVKNIMQQHSSEKVISDWMSVYNFNNADAISNGE